MKVDVLLRAIAVHVLDACRRAGTFAPPRRIRACLRALTMEATRAGVLAPGPHLTEEPGRTAAGPVWLREGGQYD